MTHRIISEALGVTERIFAVLYVSVMGLTRFHKTKVFLTFILTYNRNMFRRRWRLLQPFVSGIRVWRV